jgi:immune inhibitor A
MSKNGWIACIIGLLVLTCAGVFCLVVSLIGVAGYLPFSPAITFSIPFHQLEISNPSPSPVVIRPTQQSPLPSPIITIIPVTPPSDTITPFPDVTPSAILVPTDILNLLENTFIPSFDPVDLAHRLLGLDGLSATETPPQSFYQVGAQQTFWVGTGEEENFPVQATLRYVTDHAYFWIEDSVTFRQAVLTDLADAFENQIYPTTRSYFGSEWTPGVDGDPHIYILYARGLGDRISGYFSSTDEYPPQINRYSNGHEMFQINADNSPLDSEYTLGVLAHEFQHMILWNQDQNEENWVSEGFSELAALLNKYYSGGFDALYTSDPDLQLNDWPDDSKEESTPHYGASFLFFTYFLDRFGENAVRELVANQDNGFKSIDSTLQQIYAIDPLTGQPITAINFFRDWTITNYLMDRRVADGRFSYTSYRGAPRIKPTETFYNCPIPITTRDVHQFGADYIRFNCPGSYTFHFEGSIQTPLLPQDPHSGDYAFWANRNDESDTTLTRSFDLTGYSGPLSLSYWTWFDLEDNWDYVYLEASIDGDNWQILTTPSGTSDNLQANNYGWGYTGFSGAGASPIWIHETVDLTQFAGQNLFLRFEYITDSNVTGEGFLLDDLSIPEVDYTTDFETDNAGWQAEGWARIQNILPQTYSLTLISQGDNTTVQYITLNPDITADVPFTIGNGVDNVVLVVSGTTQFTRQLAPYRFSVSQP